MFQGKIVSNGPLGPLSRYKLYTNGFQGTITNSPIHQFKNSRIQEFKNSRIQEFTIYALKQWKNQADPILVWYYLTLSLAVFWLWSS